MDFSANHSGFVIASYALSFVFLAGLIASTLIRDRRLRHELELLDTQRQKARS